MTTQMSSLTRRILVVVFLLAGGVCMASAQEGIRDLTLRDAIDLALRHSPTIQAAQHQVDEIVPAAESLSRTFTIKISLQPEPGLRSGLYGKAHFHTGERRVLVVPRTAIATRGQLKSVFVIEDGNITRLRLIQTGKGIGDGVEVLSGLHAGERVITAGGSQVVDGSRVEDEE